MACTTIPWLALRGVPVTVPRKRAFSAWVVLVVRGGRDSSGASASSGKMQSSVMTVQPWRASTKSRRLTPMKRHCVAAPREVGRAPGGEVGGRGG